MQDGSASRGGTGTTTSSAPKRLLASSTPTRVGGAAAQNPTSRNSKQYVQSGGSKNATTTTIMENQQDQRVLAEKAESETRRLQREAEKMEQEKVALQQKIALLSSNLKQAQTDALNLQEDVATILPNLTSEEGKILISYFGQKLQEMAKGGSLVVQGTSTAGGNANKLKQGSHNAQQGFSSTSDTRSIATSSPAPSTRANAASVGPPVLHKLKRHKDTEKLHDARKDWYERFVIPELLDRVSDYHVEQKEIRERRSEHEDYFQGTVLMDLKEKIAENEKFKQQQEGARRSYNTVIADLREIFEDHHDDKHPEKFSRISEQGSILRRKQQFHAVLKDMKDVLKTHLQKSHNMEEEHFLDLMDEFEQKLYHHDDDALNKFVRKYDDPVGADKVVFPLDHGLDSGGSEGGLGKNNFQAESHYFYQHHVIHKKKAGNTPAQTPRGAARPNKSLPPPATPRAVPVPRGVAATAATSTSGATTGAGAGADNKAKAGSVVEFLTPEEAQLLREVRARRAGIAAVTDEIPMTAGVPLTGLGLGGGDAKDGGSNGNNTGTVLPAPRGLVFPPPTGTVGITGGFVPSSRAINANLFGKIDLSAAAMAATTSPDANQKDDSNIVFEAKDEDDSRRSKPTFLRLSSVVPVAAPQRQISMPPAASPRTQTAAPGFLTFVPKLEPPTLGAGMVVDARLFHDKRPRKRIQSRERTPSPSGKYCLVRNRNSGGEEQYTVELDLKKIHEEQEKEQKRAAGSPVLGAASPRGAYTVGAADAAVSKETLYPVVVVKENEVEMTECGGTLYVKKHGAISHHRAVGSSLFSKPLLLTGNMGRTLDVTGGKPPRTSR